MFGVLIIAVMVIPLPSMQHFIPHVDDCTLAAMCNHTGIRECGKERDKKSFLDECDMFEYNCDNKKGYTKTNITECDELTTRATTELMNVSTCPPFTTCSCQTDATTATSTTTTSNTTSIITPVTAPITTTKITTMPITKTQITTTPITTTSVTATPTTTVPTTLVTTPIVQNSECTRNESTKMTKLTTQISTNPSKATIEASTVTTVEYEEVADETTQTASLSLSSKATCSGYPNDCEIPSTWETTSVGETRDYVQIMKSLFGRRVRFLKATTHFSHSAPMLQRYARGSFVLGRHNES